MAKRVYLTNFARTVIGKRDGGLASFNAKELLLKLCEAKLDFGKTYQNLILAMTRTAGYGPVIHRQLAHCLGLKNIETNSINSGCISGLQALVDAYRIMQCTNSSSTNNTLLVSMESFSRAPFIEVKMELASPATLVRGQIVKKPTYLTKREDHNVIDGFLCGIAKTVPLQQVVDFLKIYPKTRQELDIYALESHRRALVAWDTGIYDPYVLCLNNLKRDETIRVGGTLESFAKAPGVFNQNVVAVSNCTSPGDASGFVVCSNSPPSLSSQKRLIEFIDFSYGECDVTRTFLSSWPAIQDVLSKNNLKPQDIHVWEISDPFSLVGLWYAEKLGVSNDKINRYGGTLSLGHPSGFTSMRCVQNAMMALQNDAKAKYAVVSSPGHSGASLAVLLKAT
jgi:acetyl-CoA acetyltransferase